VTRAPGDRRAWDAVVSVLRVRIGVERLWHEVQPADSTELRAPQRLHGSQVGSSQFV